VADLSCGIGRALTFLKVKKIVDYYKNFKEAKNL